MGHERVTIASWGLPARPAWTHASTVRGEGGRGARWLAAGLVLGLVAACGSPTVPATPTATPTPYDGPLWIAPDPTVDLWNDPGAAGRVVTCDQPVLGESSTSPFTGGEVGETAEAGLRAWRDDSNWPGYDGEMRAARRESDRVLFVYTAGGRTLQAAVVHRGPAAPGTGAGTDGIAWYVESSARCDVVEYPDGLAESHGIEVWTGPGGRRVSSQVISSWTSDGDCLERGVRVLDVGSDGRRRYLAHGEAYPDATDEPFRQAVALPGDAVDSGYRHADERLWFSPDERRAYVGTPAQVDVWPRGVDVPACG